MCVAAVLGRCHATAPVDVSRPISCSCSSSSTARYTMCPPAPTSGLTGFGPCPTQSASSAVRGAVVGGGDLLFDAGSDVVVVVRPASLPPLEQAASSSTAGSTIATIRPTAP